MCDGKGGVELFVFRYHLCLRGMQVRFPSIAADAFAVWVCVKGCGYIDVFYYFLFAIAAHFGCLWHALWISADLTHGDGIVWLKTQAMSRMPFKLDFFPPVKKLSGSQKLTWGKNLCVHAAILVAVLTGTFKEMVTVFSYQKEITCFNASLD